MSPTRRTFLAGLGTTVAGLAGCLGKHESPTESTPAEPATTRRPTTRRSTTDGTPTATDTPGIVLSHVADPGAIGAPVVVLPSNLRRWLREAAHSGDALRAHAEVSQYDPEPLLPRFDAVALDAPDGEVAGTYDLTAAGGTRYELLVGAARVDDVPSGETVTPVADLPPERRRFAREAITASARVYPETSLGSWVRHEFFGGYFRHDGTTYRGKELDQTDAEFFAQAVWYVFSLSPDDVSPAVTLALPDLSVEVEQAFTSMLSAETTPPKKPTATAVPDEVARFAAANEYVLTHTDVYAVSTV